MEKPTNTDIAEETKVEAVAETKVEPVKEVVKEEVKGYEIELDTGLEPVVIRDSATKELLGTIYFNPTDFNILKRFDEARTKILAVQKEFEEEDIELKEDGTPIDTKDEIIHAVDKLNKVICEQLDYVFDAKISKIVFGNKSPLALIKGNLLFENFMSKVQPFIEMRVKDEMAKSEKKISKHTSKYNTKKR